MSIKVKDIMTRKPVTIEGERSVFDAAKKMKEENISALPVCGPDGIKGMITEKDIVTMLVAEGKDPKKTKARELQGWMWKA